MSLSHAIVIASPGDADVLKLRPVDVPTPGPRELLIRQTAIGVNYHDVYVRSGLYKTLPFPGIPGIEAVGRVEAVGDHRLPFKRGDRVGYVSSAYGAYAERRVIPAAVGVRLPATLSDAQGAATLMKAMTAYVLLHQVHIVQNQEYILVHAAAGGVGQILCSWARALGATVIGTVGSDEKAMIARRAGAAHTIRYDRENFSARVREITGGAGVAAAFDSVGQATFAGSLECLDYFGHLVNFGQSSGKVPAFSPDLLASRSLSVSRPIIFHWLRDPPTAGQIAEAVFAALETGVINPISPLQMPLKDAAAAHRILESRGSPGGVVLIPQHS